MKLEDKICPAGEVEKRLKTLRRKLVMTNGVFDVLHRGHVSYLNDAARLGSSLLVAINSDVSARQLGKGDERPLNNAFDRAYVLAGLAAVDMVIYFDATTPLEVLKAVHPDVYVKGADYDIELLEETRLVRSWGGQSVAIPFLAGFSTTALVNRIRLPLRKAAFLDRDGVINEDRGYVGARKDFVFLPGAIEGMRSLQDAGYLVVIVTNQSGIARGLYSSQEYEALTGSILGELAIQGIKVERVYHCPHHPDGVLPEFSVECDCRKPKPGMLLGAARDLNIALSKSVLFGDKASDIDAANGAGVGKAYIVNSHLFRENGQNNNTPDQFGSLHEAVDCYLKNRPERNRK